MAFDHPTADDDSEITAWGIAALLCGALAVLAANVSPLLPDHMLLGLHVTRLESGNASQMRAQHVETRAENARLAHDYGALLARLEMLDDENGEAVRRLAALERSLPLIVETRPLDSGIDNFLLTASFSESGREIHETDGGTVVVRKRALFAAPDTQSPHAQPMPPLPVGTAYGLALGDVSPETAALHRAEILLSAGPMLRGLTFVLGESPDPALVRVIAGPFDDREQASVLCEPLTVMGLECEAVAFRGEPWPG